MPTPGVGLNTLISFTNYVELRFEYSLESALGQFALSKSTVSELSDTLSEEYEAWRTRDLSKESVTYLFIDTVYEPLRRWGQKTGILCVWAICEDGRKVLLSLSTTNSES